VTSIVFVFSLAGCTGGGALKAKTGDMPDRYPPGLIEGNLNDASYALHVVVEDVRIDEAKSLRSDNGKFGYAAVLFDCEVVDAYKGDLIPGDGVSFVAFWEYYETLLEEQRKEGSHRIVFLNKSQSGSYHALSFGVFVFAKDLDASIKGLVRTVR
jgi:hypothetical protein